MGAEMMRTTTGRAAVLSALLAFGCAGASESNGAGHDRQGASGEERAASCPATLPAPTPLAGVSEELLTLDYWLARAAEGELDEPLLSPEAIASHNRALTSDDENGLPIDRGSLAEAPDAARLAREVRERLSYLREQVTSGEYVDASGARVPPSTLEEAPLRAEPALRIATARIPLRCGPRQEGLFKTPIDAAFDRNNCSTIRPQEPVQVLMRWPNGMLLARTRYSLGWIAADAPLSPAVPDDLRDLVLSGATVEVRGGTELTSPDGATLAHEDDVLLPARAADQALFADERGFHDAPVQGSISTSRPLTRRAVLEEAFRRIGRPYGWGGQEGGLDCSRFLMDVLASFGLEVPRHSGRQAASGTHTIDLSEIEDLDERQRLIDAAARRGIVLLHFPGHIMLYLGRDAEGTPRVIHSFSEYLEPCEGGGDTVRRVDRVTVSDLTLGRGSSRRSFLERIDRVVVLGRTMGQELIGVAAPRAAAPVQLPDARTCDDSLRVRVFSSPAAPNPRQPLRVIVTATEELGPVELALFDPAGERHTPETHRLGGPPFTYWAQIDAPAPGRWTAVLGDGARIEACDRIAVAPFPVRPRALSPEAVWTPRLRWEADTEALFSAFVEQLFDYPVDEDLTWPNLTVLLQDRDRNLLFNHLGQEEEERINLQPDCADLPYFLRTYFAWKMRLPFAFRTCTRGRRGELPTCGELEHPGIPHEYTDEVEAFRWFIGQRVKHGVHSASGRTHPEDSLTALYPVPMTREALRPGTVFADPYGHLLVIARWVPQGAGDRYGILVGADAQPDGTVGRRRFWRGTFLFDPDTTHVGAGFKAWRPVIYDPREHTYEALPNERITERAGYVPFSMQQYEGTTDQYYERMEAVINPRPLDPWRVQRSLIDALAESSARRVVSVQNGEDWKARNPGAVMEMPEGGAIFLTAGPWEEYSTPARDMRMLIAMDTVMGFVDVLRRDPARFGVREEDVEASVERVTQQRDAELARRTFTYRRSDGAQQTLTLAQLVERMRAFEMAYNPNDCVELRWGAQEGSAEMRTCQRHAPAEQRARMAEYREWFATRHRPIY